MSKVLDNLNNVSFINNIMTACCRIFHDSSFKEKLDSNPETINSDPYGAGWIAEIEIASAPLQDVLLSAADYQNLTA